MNTTLTTESRHIEQRTLPVRRVGLLDRAALHLGVALIKWGRRTSGAPLHERRANMLERSLLSNERDRAVDAHRQRTVLLYGSMSRMP